MNENCSESTRRRPRAAPSRSQRKTGGHRADIADEPAPVRREQAVEVVALVGASEARVDGAGKARVTEYSMMPSSAMNASEKIAAETVNQRNVVLCQWSGQ
ncbi:hypothetical protein [Paraburkholderia sp. BR10872]|uniref:hypothetical protein n=1 Tax=Paraburkholderia sp. BR10872 TaxID=3236989 RepID=UPI0034D1BD7F